jgi:hypothetical protein
MKPKLNPKINDGVALASLTNLVFFLSKDKKIITLYFIFINFKPGFLKEKPFLFDIKPK